MDLSCVSPGNRRGVAACLIAGAEYWADHPWPGHYWAIAPGGGCVVIGSEISGNRLYGWIAGPPDQPVWRQRGYRSRTDSATGSVVASVIRTADAWRELCRVAEIAGQR